MKTEEEIKAKLEFCKTALVNCKVPKLNITMFNGAKRELRNMHNWYEVIGNIYENPELLED